MIQHKPKILIVDDKSQNLYAMEKALQKLPVEVIQATTGSEALALALEHDLCLAVVDVQMPGMDGYELVELLRGNESTTTLPVIFVSAIHSDDYHHRKGYDAGAVDFLSKPFSPDILLSKVKVFLDLYHQRLQLQATVDQLDHANLALAKRALQLETSNQVARQLTSLLDLDRLLPEVAGVIQASFGCYLVGIWLRDAAHGTAVLRAVSHDGDRQAIKAGYVLPLDTPRSIIAHVCRTARPYLANDVSADAVYMSWEGLPSTRSELTLPLQVGQDVLGALDIQSRQAAAFDPQDVTVLHTLADQIAIAIRNAQLYTQVVHFNEELEDKVRQRTAELEQAYRHLELLDHNKSDFIEVISHELRTPLTLIQGYSQLLLRRRPVKEDPTCVLQIEGIVTGASRLHEIVNSMLDIVKIDTHALELRPAQVSLPGLFESLRAQLADALQVRRLSLALQDMSALPSIEADPDALRKLFDHLLTNAVKYTPDGGAISVAGRLVNAQPDLPGERFVHLVVSDTGIGIAADFHEMIFAKFYQTGEVALHSSGKTKFKGGGPGLGLAIARGITLAHGGRIWVESPGYDEETCPGSQFHVVLPVAFPGAPLSPSSASASAPASTV